MIPSDKVFDLYFARRCSCCEEVLSDTDIEAEAQADDGMCEICRNAPIEL